MSSLLTRALFFKPKKLQSPFEHRHGFLVSIDAQTALNIISNAENDRKDKSYHAELPNPYLDYDHEFLRRMAEKTFYEIESSSTNYVEITSVVGGLFIGVWLLGLLPKVWSYHRGDEVHLFMILVLVLGVLILLYLLKRKRDKENLKRFLDIEDALYYHEYGRRLFYSKR